MSRGSDPRARRRQASQPGRGAAPAKPRRGRRAAPAAPDPAAQAHPDQASALVAFSRQILWLASRGLPREAFVREATVLLRRHAPADGVEIWAEDGSGWIGWLDRGQGHPAPVVLQQAQAPDLADRLPAAAWQASASGARWGRQPRAPGTALALVGFSIDPLQSGQLLLTRHAPQVFEPGAVQHCEALALMLGIAIAARRAQAALSERVKELSCVYGIARLADQPDLPLPDLLRSAVDLLPPAWQFPELASARVVFECDTAVSRSFRPSSQRLSAPITVKGSERGSLTVVYAPDERGVAPPFLPEEEHLLAAVADELGLLIERRLVHEERERLRDQLQHADRLATIGQLAAGVAHELNEPLGSILGFAQLAAKTPGLPPQAAADLDKIARATLFAREIIRKLMIFARRAPARMLTVDLNQSVREGLLFLESRCAKEGIALEQRLHPEPLPVVGDPAQLQQVLVNLVVNAIQATCSGGRLGVYTGRDEGQALLIVEDSGCGMPEEVQRQLFVPFFTTKEVGQGTGLGLSVVHGIVTAHGGSIHVTSAIGRGSTFTVRLPLQSA